jgi:phytoene desaturase
MFVLLFSKKYKRLNKMNISVIGSGFASLSAAAYLARAGNEVTVFEKNSTIGGRARFIKEGGFMFDMGPSWYWMPEVFEDFFTDHGSKVDDHYELVRLDPSYQVFFEDRTIDIPANYDALLELFESLEENGAAKLKRFLKSSEKKYNIAMDGLIQLPGKKISELIKPSIIKSAFQLSLTKSFSRYVANQFSSTHIRRLLEFPILFLGSTPNKIPALYSMLNYADMKLGTWYPMGGMSKIIGGMQQVLENYNVKIRTSSEVESFVFDNKKIQQLRFNNSEIETDMVVAGADYHHVENSILPNEFSQYSDKYWDKRELAPSAIIMYLGVKGKIPGLLHHNLFFDAPFDEHLNAIYGAIDWPENPLFYISNPSKTDKSVAPEGHENLFVLIPTAPDLINDDDTIAESFLKVVIERLKKKINVDISDRIIYKRFFQPKQFVSDYHAFKGNAYGLANTLAQTHYLKPRIKHNKISNLYYTGQLTVPGPGVPPSIMSGEIVANQITNRKL